jgi:nucleoside-diphosphate-sugar epimerase
MLTAAKPLWSRASSLERSRKSGSFASSFIAAFRTTRFTERVWIAVGAEVPIEFTERLEDDPQVRRPDISLAILELGWEPKVQLDTILERKVVSASEAWTS